MKFRDASYVVGGYVVDAGRVLLLWHEELSRWVPAGGRIEVASGEYPHEAAVREVAEETSLIVEVISAPCNAVFDSAVAPVPAPFCVQEIRVSESLRYLDFVYFCRVIGGNLALDYHEARAYRWFTRSDLKRFPLLPHVRQYGDKAILMAS